MAQGQHVLPEISDQRHDTLAEGAAGQGGEEGLRRKDAEISLEGGPVMAYILQQVFVGLGLIWALWALWGEVRALMEEEEEKA